MAHVYRPLKATEKEIRLLEVQPGAGTDVVRCSIKHVLLVVQLEHNYETISYVWGDANERANVSHWRQSPTRRSMTSGTS